MTAINYQEVQRFKIWWAWIGVASLNIVLLYAIVQQVIIGKKFGTKPAPDYVLILIELFLLLVLIFFMTIRLKTRITDNGIYYRFYPFQFKETFIAWHELRDAYMRVYHSFYEYGGWGLRTGTDKTGKALNTSASSNQGLQLQFHDGRLLLIGTARPDEIQLIITDVLRSGKINRGV